MRLLCAFSIVLLLFTRLFALFWLLAGFFCFFLAFVKLWLSSIVFSCFRVLTVFLGLLPLQGLCCATWTSAGDKIGEHVRSGGNSSLKRQLNDKDLTDSGDLLLFHRNISGWGILVFQLPLLPGKNFIVHLSLKEDKSRIKTNFFLCTCMLT